MAKKPAKITAKSTAVRGNPAKLTAPRWKPGQSGNPKGRPKGLKDGITPRIVRGLKGKATAEAIRELERRGIHCDEGSVAEVAALRLLEILQTGTFEEFLKALKETLDRTEGRPKQSLEHAGPEGGPVLTADMANMDAEQLAQLDGLYSKLFPNGNGKKPEEENDV